MNQKTKKALNITSYVLIGLIALIALSVLMINLSVKNENDVPKLFGASVLMVESDSMKDTGINKTDYEGKIDNKIYFNKGDLIFIKRLNSLEERSSLKIGDVVTYWVPEKQRFNTHMIVEPPTAPAGGAVRYVTRGVGLDDNGNQIPQNEEGNDASILSTNIIGVYTGKIPAMGAVFKFFKSPLGFGLLIVLPMFAFLAYRVFVVIKLVVAINKEKKEGVTVSEMEAMQAEIERLKAELKGDKPEKGGAENGRQS